MPLSGIRERAFTLIETLVVIAIVSVLIALTAPALTSGRESARLEVCFSNLRTIAQLQSAYATDAADKWPNAFGPRTDLVTWVFGCTQYDATSVFSQTWLWVGPLSDAGLLDVETDVKALSCPSVLRVLDRQRIEINPQIGPIRSYAFSSAFLSSPELWDPANAQRLDDPERLRASLTHAATVFPSGKVTLFEWGDHHNDGAVINHESPTSRSNVVFADGHVQRAAPARAERAMEFPWNSLYGPDTPDALPFSSAPGGITGKDF